jgi:hypothetical protein
MQTSTAAGPFATVFFLILSSVFQTPVLSQVSDPPEWCDAVVWHRECSTRGVHLALVETERTRLQTGTLVSYGLTWASVPSGKVYSIWIKPTHGPAQLLLTGLTGDPAGRLICVDSTEYAARPRIPAMLGWCGPRTLENIMLSAPPSFALGEALRVALISTDETVAVFAEAIPYRLDASAAGCTVEGEMLSVERFAFSGSGFTPGETLEVVSRSGRDIIRRTATADDGGRLPTTIVVPNVPGRSGGDATIEVTGGSCRVVLRYGWGDRLRGPRQ